jgi:DNA primase
MQIPRLHPDTIEQIKERADIVDVVSEHVVLRKQGKDYVGLCPFHDEKTPSFSISPQKQMYYCFGCQAGGNAIKFLMEVGKHSFNEVVLDLARRYQVPVQTLEPEQRQELQRQLSQREQLYEILAVTASFYEHALHQSQGRLALEYLQTQRCLRPETIQQFQLGYAPAGWETLYKYLVEQKQFAVQLVEKAGLIVPRKSGGGYYDRFRDRLMIPIHDLQGRVIAFGGRSLGDEQPKYLNSPETDLFAKGKTLFALDKAREAIAKQDQAVVVEGYFDAIALHAAGITQVVASQGTALSLDQVRLLLRYTDSKQIILNFDADAAGTNAAERAIGEIANLAYQGQVQLRILNLPDGKDADEFLKEDLKVAAGSIQRQATISRTEQYQERLKTAPLWLDWQIQQSLINRDLKQADQSQQVADQMVKLLSNITDHNTRAHYLQQCAEILSRNDVRLVPLLLESLGSQLKKFNRAFVKGNDKSQRLTALPVAAEQNLLQKAEALLLQIYLHCPEYRAAIIDALEERDLLFSFSHHRFLWQQILDIEAKETLTQEPESLISFLQDRSLTFPAQMAQVSHLLHLDEKTQNDILRASLVIQAAAACMEKVSCEKHRRYCLEQWQKLDPATDPERWQYYYQEFYESQQKIKQLEQQRQFNLTALLTESMI